MIKDTIIAILTGIAIAQRITQPGDPDRVAVILVIAWMAFMALLELEDLWDKHQQIMQRTLTITSAVSKATRRILRDISSRIRWYKIRLHTYPAELARRRRRRQMMRDYIQQLREMPQEGRGRNPEESEA
ncbi:MAG: hypothetical protein K2H45_04300 [Acetatifactor sp.]|nr:hypothetical protein [Acetatifactor sp.]